MDGKRQWRLPHRGCPQGGIVASTEMLRRRCHNRVMERLRPRLAVPARPALAVPSRLAAPARLAAGLAGLAAAAGALAVAEGPGRSTTYAGRSAAGAVLTLSAGLALIAAGLVICLGPRPRRTGDLALLAGFTWFAPAWAAWQNGPPLIPSVAIVLGGFTFPLTLHLVLAYPGSRPSSAPARALIAATYAEALLAAAVLALFRDPYLERSRRGPWPTPRAVDRVKGTSATPNGMICVQPPARSAWLSAAQIRQGGCG